MNSIKKEEIFNHNSWNLKYLECYNCYKIVINGNLCSCDNLLCKDCIKMNTDLNCKKCFQKFDINLKKIFKLKINRIEIKCFNYNNGCNIVSNFINIYNHLFECKFSIEKCSNLDCNYETTKLNMNDHLIKCQYSKYVCKYCFKFLIKKDKEGHKKICKKYLVACNLCDKKIKRVKYNTHLKYCDKNLVFCKFCNKNYKLKYKHNVRICFNKFINVYNFKHCNKIKKLKIKLKKLVDKFKILNFFKNLNCSDCKKNCCLTHLTRCYNCSYSSCNNCINKNKFFSKNNYKLCKLCYKTNN